MTHPTNFTAFWKDLNLFTSKNILLVLTLQFLWFVPCRAVNVDSLRRLLPGAKGNERVILLNKLAGAFAEDSTGIATGYANEALNSARAAGFRKEEAYSLKLLADIAFNLNDFKTAIRFYTQSAEVEKHSRGTKTEEYVSRTGDVGYCYLMQNDYTHALEYFRQALDLATKGEIEEEIASNYSNIGTIYVEWGDFGEAIDNFRHAMEIDRRASRNDQISVDLNNIGKVYELWGKYELAIHYYQEALVIEQKAQNKARIAVRLNNLGTVCKAWKKYPEALDYLQQALEIETALGDTEKVGKRLAYIGSTYLAMGDYRKSYVFLNQALPILTKMDLHDELARLHNSFGKYFLAMRDYPMAIKHLNMSQVHAIAGNLKPLQISNYETLSAAWEKSNNYPEALSAYKLYMAIKDSVFTSQSDVKLAEFQAKFDNEKMSLENERLKNEARQKQNRNIIIGVLLISLVLILLALLFILRLRAKNSRQAQEMAEQSAVRYQMDIELKNKELTCKAMSIIRNNETLSEMIEGIETAIRKGESIEGYQNVLQTFRNVERDKSWGEFELRFTQVHKDFYDKLNETFPDLSPNEKKLCAFLRLNMTTKDIASITHQSVHSINVARTRLRKKINLANSDENLINFLINL
ncbi:MAG: tetratricopeptide repeat protein [Bacteroidetes bacterium]|nr:tetratricopeptide repeat protein [Bacteroidota bacterium]